jgi:hypothetical protein
MKTVITKDEIIFKYLMFNIIVPNNNYISLNIDTGITGAIGLPPGLIVRSKNVKVKPRFSFFGYLFYVLANIIRRYNPLPLTTIYFGANDALLEMKQYGYVGVDEQIKIYQEIKAQKTPEILIRGTKEYKKDKFSLMVTILVIFEIAYLFILLKSESTLSNYKIFGAVSISLFLFCFFMYKILNKKKK